MVEAPLEGQFDLSQHATTLSIARCNDVCKSTCSLVTLWRSRSDVWQPFGSAEGAKLCMTYACRDAHKTVSITTSHTPAGSAQLERDMFVLLWGPTVAAVSVVLDHADAGAIVSTALGGLLHAARIAAFHHVDEVGWNLQAGRLGDWHRMRAATACPRLLPGCSPSYAQLLDPVRVQGTWPSFGPNAHMPSLSNFLVVLKLEVAMPASATSHPAGDGQSGGVAQPLHAAAEPGFRQASHRFWRVR